MKHKITCCKRKDETETCQGFGELFFYIMCSTYDTSVTKSGFEMLRLSAIFQKGIKLETQLSLSVNCIPLTPAHGTWYMVDQ